MYLAMGLPESGVMTFRSQRPTLNIVTNSGLEWQMGVIQEKQTDRQHKAGGGEEGAWPCDIKTCKSNGQMFSRPVGMWAKGQGRLPATALACRLVQLAGVRGKVGKEEGGNMWKRGGDRVSEWVSVWVWERAPERDKKRERKKEKEQSPILRR